jgi:hypothetical protein
MSKDWCKRVLGYRQRSIGVKVHRCIFTLTPNTAPNTDGAPDKFTVGYLLPTSHGVSTDKDLEECMEIYNPVLKKVLS